MKIRLQAGLPFVSVRLFYQTQSLLLKDVLLDTGSAGTVFSVDQLASIGVQYEPDDEVHRIRGIGGSEFVFTKRVERLEVDNLSLSNFSVEVGALDYGLELDGILGMNFLLQARATLDLEKLELR